MLVDVHLHGALGVRFGNRFRIDVASPAEAVHALGVQVGGFLAHLAEGAYRVVRGPLKGGAHVVEHELGLRLGKDAEIHFVPAMAGAGSAGGVIKLIAGAALVAAAVAFSGGSLAAPLFTVLGASVTFGNIALLGLGVALAGASALLAQPPTLNSGTIDPRSGSAFGNATNTATQNGPVPVICGRFVTTPLLISFGLDAERVNLGPAQGG